MNIVPGSTRITNANGDDEEAENSQPNFEGEEEEIITKNGVIYLNAEAEILKQSTQTHTDTQVQSEQEGEEIELQETNIPDTKETKEDVL